MLEQSKDVLDKARRRIRRAVLDGSKEPRVELTGPRTGVYKFVHHVCVEAFRTDALGRVYWLSKLKPAKPAKPTK